MNKNRKSKSNKEKKIKISFAPMNMMVKAKTFIVSVLKKEL